MARVTIETIAYGRSGDKGSGSNVGLVARSPEAYEWMRSAITPAFLKDALAGIVAGRVERFELPNLLALNFVLHDSLGGGGSASLRTDAQGKTHAQAVLRLPVEVPDAVLSTIPG